MMQGLRLDAFDDGTPTVIVTKSLDGEHIVVATDVETEVDVEILRDSRIGNSEDELVERMHTERIGFSGRRDIAADSGPPLLHRPYGGSTDKLAPTTVRATVGHLRVSPHCPTKKPGADAGLSH